MVVLTLPLFFTNSFWTPDYRKGLEVLYAKLEQGVVENDEIIAFIRARAVAETQLAIALTSPVPIGQRGTGFNADDGASLLMAFRGLQGESVIQGETHKSVAKELHTLVVDPFQQWAQGYRERLKQSKISVIDNWVRSYEQAQTEVAKLKNQYLLKNRRADEAEDDAKFAPNNELGDKYTSSPRLPPHDRAPPQRTPSVSERIAQRLKEIQRKANAASEEPPKANETVFEAGSEAEKSPPLAPAPKVDKGKGKAVEESESAIVSSPPPMSPALPPAQLAAEPTAAPAPPPISLAGLSMQPSAVSALLKRAAAELELRPLRVPLLGEYQDCFNGEDFVAWLNVSVPNFGGNLDTAEEAARDLTEKYNLLRRIGELGNSFEHSDDAFYQFRPKAFDLEGKASETVNMPPTKNLAPLASNFIKRSNTFVNVVAKALNANGQSEPAHIKARHEAEEADKAFRIAIRRLDRQRLGVEEKIEETLKTLQRWETERLRAVKTVLLQYQGTLANIPKALDGSNERSKTLIATYQPESDLRALIERYRTGPFHPTPQVYESVAHDESDVTFGIDLRKWSEGGWDVLTTGEQRKELYPSVLSALLEGLKGAYGRLSDDNEKRKAWIYEVPLSAVHHLRETLNAVDSEQPIPTDFLTNYDAPVLASTIKLWLLELDPPLALWDGWDEFKKLYPTVGSKANSNTTTEFSEQQHIQELSATLQKLPRVHLYVLDALVSHFKTLIDTTSVEEDNEVYLTKLALSIGRTIVRPKFETELTLNDRHPTMLFIDLVKNYNAIIPPTISRKKRESERKIPLRKRTAPIDMRTVRGKISAGAPTRELYAAQQATQNADAALLPSLPSNVSATVSAAPIAAAKPEPAASFVAPPPPPKLEAPKVTSAPLVPPPPPPPIPVPSSIPVAPSVPILPPVPPPPPILAPPAVLSEPPRPSFKEPPPEGDDDLPPRPSFKEPPPEEDYTPPPMPHFVDPPVSPPETPPPPPPATEVTSQSPPNPVPVKRNSLITQSNSSSVSSSKRLSRSPSPPVNADRPLSSAAASISRSGSGQTGYVRGPRISVGPRTSVSSMVSNLNRHSIGGPPSSSTPSYKRLSSGSPSRPAVAQDSRARGIGRTQALSRRTMASDAEDEVVQ